MPFACLLLLAFAAHAAPLKVALLVDAPELRDTIAKSGAQVVDPASAEVLVLQTAKPDRATVEAFTKRGGGLVVIGRGITAGDWLKPHAGAAWSAQSREIASKMMLFTLTDSHPIVQSATPFDLNDETRYDLDLDPSIRVLASAFTPKITTTKPGKRRDDSPDKPNVFDLQPQMWTYEAPDQHRAFVLLQDEPATLRHASIRTFLLRGIAWAAKRENVDELCAQEDLATLRYPAGGARPAAETVKSFELQPGFHASVIASEPLITKPIAMQWDGAGRLWIAETPEYPNGRRPLVTEPWKETGVLVPGQYDRPARDRISILSEPDGNGQFTKKTVFYEGLELLTAFCLWGDGVIAVAQPDIVYIHGTGAQQKVERLYTGFTPGDTHFVANHFIAAPDGWIYANTGSGPDAQSVAFPDVKAKLSPGVFRFRPDGSKIEQIASKGGNAFGLDITSDGEIFAGQATTGNPVQHVVLPEAILAKAKVGTAISEDSVIKQAKVIRADMPDRSPFMQIDVVGGFTAACAATVQEAGAWPAEYLGAVFCSEPILDIIHCEKLIPSGPSYTGQIMPADREWLRAQDFWFFPVDIEFGPDGAMYVLDFYCPIVAHNDTRGPLHSKSGASVRPDRDHYFGRIYRIQTDAAVKLTPPNLEQADAAALVAAFTGPNKLTRFTAHRLLLARSDAASVVPALTAMAENEKFAPARILALWALQRLDKLSPQTLQAALKSENAGVRKSALLVAEALGEKNTVDLAAALNDSDPRVRLTALRAMAASPLSPDSAAALLAILPKLDDDWSRSAASAAASSNAGPVLVAALASKEAPSNALLEMADSLARKLVEKQDGEGLAKVVIAAATASNVETPLVRSILNAARPVPSGVSFSIPLLGALRALLESRPNGVSARRQQQLGAEIPINYQAPRERGLSASALPFAVAWARTQMNSELSSCVSGMLLNIQNPRVSDAERGENVRALMEARTMDSAITSRVLTLLNGKLSDPLMLDVVAAIGGTGDPALGKPLAAALPNLSPLPQNAAFEALVSRADWSGALLDALEAKELKPALLGPSRLSKLRLHSDPATAKRAQEVLEKVGGGTNPAKDEIIGKLLPEIEAKPGNAANGKTFFNATCGICHKLNGEGKEVGPVLDGIGVHGTQELLIHIIDPSRVVDDEHRTWNLAMRNGGFATGIIARENEQSLTLRMAGGIEQEIKKADIQSRQTSPLSLMPEGFEALGADTLRDILAYMSAGSSKYRAVNLAKVFTTSTTGGLYASREAKSDTVQPAKYGIVTVEGVPFSLPDPSTTATGGNVIVLKNHDGEHNRSYAGTMPQRVVIPMNFPAGNLHFLGGIAGWGGGPGNERPAMKVTIEHTDGQKQVEELQSGVVFLDYLSHEEVPGSKRAEGLTSGPRGHVRYFSLPVHDRAPIKDVVLESYLNGIAPTTLAITSDNEPPTAVPRPAEAAPKPKKDDPLPPSGETLSVRATPGTIRALLIGGGSSHDFEKYFHQSDSATLEAAGGIVTAYTENAPEAAALLAHADVAVISANHSSFGTPEFQNALQAFADAGHGVVVVHAGVWYNWKGAPEYNQRFVGGGTRGHGKGEFTVINKQPAHPVMVGVPAEFKITDEHYRVILEPGAPVEVLAETEPEHEGTHLPYPSVWVVKDPKARIVCTGLGHDDRAHDHPAYRSILVNAVRWAAGK